MPGQAVIGVNENQWTVSLATTYTELTTGLRGVALPAGTGMLFILPAAQAVSVDTTGMNFALDIIFIANNIVIDVARNVEPGYLVTEETPCDSFLEVNAGEAADVEAGDTVSTTAIQEPGFDWSTITSFAIPLAALGFVCAMAGGMMTGVVGSSSSPKQLRQSSAGSQWRKGTRFIGGCKVVDGLCHTHGYSVSKTIRCPQSPLTDEEWAAAWELAEAAYPEGMSNPWVNGWWPETMEEAEGVANVYEWKMKDAIRMFREKQRAAIENYERSADKAIYNYHRYVVGEYERGKELSVVASPSGHHSMWLTLEQRKELDKKYGAVAVRWAEEATKPNDMEGVEVAAEYYYGKIREAFGLGHLSPQLTEEQIERLREVLGLTASVAEVLKIHKETGYIA